MEFLYKHMILTLVLVVLNLSEGSAIWACTGDADCSSLAGSVCTTGECVCPVGHQVVDSGRRCAEAAPYYLSQCVDHFQCSRLFSHFQCHVDENSEGTCRCLPGYHYFHGRCWETKSHGDDCSRDEECQSSELLNPFAMECQGGACACSEGYYLRQRDECRKYASAPGERCVLDIDCQFPNGACDFPTFTCYNTEDAVSRSNKTSADVKSNMDSKMAARQHGVACGASIGGCDDPFVCSNLGICICPSGYYSSANGLQCLAELGSPGTEANCVGLFAEIVDGLCVCPANLFFEDTMRDCVKVAARFSDSCLSDAMCGTFGAASVCGDPTEPWGLRSCQCLPELAVKEEHNSVCRLFSGIGEVCELDTDCMAGIVEIECRPDDEGVGRCACPADMEQLGNLCLNMGLGLGEWCQVTEECTGAENSVCQNNICACDVGYEQSGDICAPVIGGVCAADEDCVIDNTHCEDDDGVSTCQCRAEFVENEESCWPVSHGFNSSCLIDEQCGPSLGDGSHCGDGFCQCSTGYHFSDDYCWQIRGLFEPCARRSECYLGEATDRVVCRNSRCECDFDHPFQVQQNTCGSSATSVGGSVTLLVVSIVCLFK